MNKRTIYYPILAMLGLSLLLASCKKEEEAPPAPTKKQLLTGNNWVRVGHTVDPEIDYDNDGTQEGDLIPFYQSCELDDLIDFNADNSYTSEEGATKCNPNDPQVFESGTWAFNSDETRVVMTPAVGEPYEYQIESISSTSLVVEQLLQVDGVTYTITSTFD